MLKIPRPPAGLLFYLWVCFHAHPRASSLDGVLGNVKHALETLYITVIYRRRRSKNLPPGLQGTPQHSRDISRSLEVSVLQQHARRATTLRRWACCAVETNITTTIVCVSCGTGLAQGVSF